MHTLSRRIVTAFAVLCCASPVWACRAPAPCCPPPPDDIETKLPELMPPDADEHRFVAKALRAAICDAIMREPTKGEAKSGKVVVPADFGTELTTIAGFTLVRGTPQGGSAWTGERNAAAHPKMLMYRIRWFNGNWSKWFIPGVNDRDWKDRTGRVWRYFTDHAFEYVELTDDAPLGARAAYVGLNP